MGKTLKERFSAALIKGTTVATLLTAGGHAAAQTGSTQEKQEHKLEYSQNPYRSMEVPVFFQDKHLEMSQADFSKAMDKAEVDKAERVYLLKKFNQLMQSANGVTEKNFDWMMDIAVADGKLNPDKAQIISKATEQGEPSLFFSTEQLAKAVHESGVSEEKRQAFLENYMAAVDSELKITPRGLIKVFEKAGFTKQEVIKAGGALLEFSKKEKDKDANATKPEMRRAASSYAKVNYAFTEKGLVTDATGSLHTQRLLPEIYEDGKGIYRCGTQRGKNFSLVKMLEEQAIRNLAVQEVIYQDLTHRAGEGEILGKQEQAFMQNHPENMKKHGLYTDKSGKLQQKDKRTGMARILPTARSY